MSNQRNIRATKNYEMFDIGENRAIESFRVREKKRTLGLQGWLWTQPMTCARNGKGKLIIVDGQHRFMAAQELGIPVFFVVLGEDESVDVASLNSSVGKWNAANYQQYYDKKGVEVYDEVKAFADTNEIPLSDAAGFLAGTSWTNVRKSWMEGVYEIKDREHADAIAYLWGQLRKIPGIKGTRSLREALVAVSRVPDFDPSKLIRKAKRIPEKFAVNYATREGALDMLEEVYNYGQSTKYPLKVNAENAMRERNAAKPKE